MKIQINSLEALERMIGGDTEIEIEVRRSIMEEFAKNHLKALADSELKRYVEELIKATKEELSKGMIKKNSAWPYNLELSAEIKELIKDEIKGIILSLIKESWQGTEEEVEKQLADYKERIPKYIDHQIVKKFEEEINAEIEKRWTKIKASMNGK